MIEPARPRQLPLELGHSPAFSRDDLVITPANASAVALIDRWPDWPGPLAVLFGPAGSGKTHLGEVWRRRSGAALLDRHALSGPLAPQPVLVDDVDAGELDETGLFHLVNAARQSGTHVLLLARRPPAAWPVTLPDLASRLRAATLVEVREPDDMLLAGVITKLFADRQVDIEPQVVEFLVRRIERSLAAAMAMVERLDRAALEQKARITRSLAAGLMRNDALQDDEAAS
ncbi:MAG: hypothetical protein JNL61_04740 [Rhizobiaceae bacterium]|nr:hypothetical protein [Rhizobiaceae bacterium]